MNEQTYWNDDPAPARIVRVIVGEPPMETFWCADLIGEEREAVEVSYRGHKIYLDNEDGSGWDKVTRGGGNRAWGHNLLPVRRVAGEQATPFDLEEMEKLAEELHPEIGSLLLSFSHKFPRCSRASESLSSRELEFCETSAAFEETFTKTYARIYDFAPWPLEVKEVPAFRLTPFGIQLRNAVKFVQARAQVSRRAALQT